MMTLDVLVVDNEPAIRQAIGRVLRNRTVRIKGSDTVWTFSVLESESALNAAQLIQSSPPDIVLIDHDLPDRSGLDLIEEINETKLDLMLIMMSAYASVETVVTATKHGAYDFIAKPFTPEELRASIQKAARHLVIRRHALKLAAEKRQVRFQSISVLAHELKAPLASIEGYLRILRDGKAIPDKPTYDKVLDRSLLRLDGMRKLILDLLDLTRIESGQKKRETEQIDVRDIAESAIETGLPRAMEKQVSIHLHCDEPAEMLADRNEIEIIFNNLITNAITYNRENGSVEVTVQTKGKHIRITVSDTGIGMSSEEVSHVFEEFYRAKNANTQTIPGSGLGMAIVKKIVALYHGRIAVDSVQEEGTTFTVDLEKKCSKQSDNHIPNPLNGLKA
jgi:two-component system, sensor histidine kinase and response regulator